MSKVFLITVRRPAEDKPGHPFPPDRIMVEAAGPASALDAYARRYVDVDALTAGAALRLQKDGVEHIDGTGGEADAE